MLYGEKMLTDDVTVLALSEFSLEKSLVDLKTY